MLDLSDEQVNEIRRKLETQSMAVSTIASPIGKVPVDSPFDEHLQHFERAITLAQIFSTPLYVFSRSIPRHRQKAILPKINDHMYISNKRKTYKFWMTCIPTIRPIA